MKIYSPEENFLVDTPFVHCELNFNGNVYIIYQYVQNHSRLAQKYEDEKVLNGNAVITIEANDIAHAVIKNMAEFFCQNPNGVYFMPTQEQGLELAKRNLESNKAWKVDY